MAIKKNFYNDLNQMILSFAKNNFTVRENSKQTLKNSSVIKSNIRELTNDFVNKLKTVYNSAFFAAQEILDNEYVKNHFSDFIKVSGMPSYQSENNSGIDYGNQGVSNAQKFLLNIYDWIFAALKKIAN